MIRKESDLKNIYYIVLGPARSGTTFIHRLIASHPNVSALSDEININNSFFQQGIKLFTLGNHTNLEQERSFSLIIKTLCSLNADMNTTACGCKVALHYASETKRFYDFLTKYLRDFKIIYISREDLVAQYGSYLRAHITGKTHSDHNIYSYYHASKFGISTIFFRRYLTHQLWIRHFLESISKTQDVLSLSYEHDIINNNRNLFSKICDFLNLPLVQPEKNAQQKVSPQANKFIKNYSALQQTMKYYIENFDPKTMLIPSKPRYNYYLLYKTFIHRTIPKYFKFLQNG